LVDCGLQLGSSPEARRHNRTFPFRPADLAAVILTHAHIDHCGNLPNLVRQGFAGPIYCIPATRDLVELMLAESARIQEEEKFVLHVLERLEEPESHLASFRDDARRAVRQCIPLPYGQVQEI